MIFSRGSSSSRDWATTDRGSAPVGVRGSASLPPLSLWSDVDRIGFGPDIGTRGGHDLATALGNTWANVAVLLRHLFGWPSYLTLSLALVPRRVLVRLLPPLVPRPPLLGPAPAMSRQALVPRLAR